MNREAHCGANTIERLEEQSELLLKMYESDLAKHPTSAATKSSRSNMIALCHSVDQIYGQVAAPVVASALGTDSSVVRS